MCVAKKGCVQVEYRQRLRRGSGVYGVNGKKVMGNQRPDAVSLNLVLGNGVGKYLGVS